MTPISPSDRLTWERQIPLRYTDLDLLEHVTAAMYLVMFEEARGAWMAEALEVRFPIYVLAHQQIDYVREVVYEDSPVTISVAPVRLGRSSVSIHERLVAGDGELRAISRATLVMWDLDTRVPRPLLDDERERLERYLIDEPEVAAS